MSPAELATLQRREVVQHCGPRGRPAAEDNPDQAMCGIPDSDREGELDGVLSPKLTFPRRSASRPQTHLSRRSARKHIYCPSRPTRTKAGAVWGGRQAQHAPSHGGAHRTHTHRSLECTYANAAVGGIGSTAPQGESGARPAMPGSSGIVNPVKTQGQTMCTGHAVGELQWRRPESGEA